jgi:hypothetical protein
MLTLENVKDFCAEKGISVNNLLPPQEDYAERLLQKYTWQTSARYIALVCHKDYGKKSSLAKSLERFYKSPLGQDFKKPGTNEEECNIAFKKNRIQNTNLPDTEVLANIENLLHKGIAVQKIADRYGLSARKVLKVRDQLITTHPELINQRKRKNASNMKHYGRKSAIKSELIKQNDISFTLLSERIKAACRTVMSAWEEMLITGEANQLLLTQEQLTGKLLFTNHRKLSPKEVSWAQQNLKQGWTTESIAYAMRVNKNCLLKYLIDNSYTR